MSNNKIEQEGRLVSENMGLVYSLVKSFRPPNDTEYDEYIQSGSLGLLKAIRNYNPEKGKLSSFAWPYIKGYILRYIKANSRQTRYMRDEELKEEIAVSHMSKDISYVENVYELFPTSLTTMEKRIVEMKISGHTVREIAKDLGGYSRWWIYVRLNSAIEKIKHANS